MLFSDFAIRESMGSEPQGSITKLPDFKITKSLHFDPLHILRDLHIPSQLFLHAVVQLR
jgi:hypothetical protein